MVSAWGKILGQCAFNIEGCPPPTPPQLICAKLFFLFSSLESAVNVSFLTRF